MSDATYAEELGYSLTEMDEDGFVITRCGNGIYLLAPTEEGVNRASAYFARNFVETDGTVLEIAKAKKTQGNWMQAG